MTWQPIETAPKDGSDILAYQAWPDGKQYRMLVMRWDTSPKVEPRWRTNIHSFVAFDPTHWMPLPEPPSG